MVFAVGLTGNIASGKTTVAELFANLGIDVINADKISRELTAKGQDAYHEIVSHFGSHVLRKDGELDRQQLRTIIFSKVEERVWLEALLHPLIRQKMEQQVNSSTTPYCIVEIPLLLDKINYPYLNRILVISAPEKKQIARVMERDKCSKEHAIAILSTQPDSKARIEMADDLINNDSDLGALKQAVETLHHKYIKHSNCSPGAAIA